MVVLNLRFHGLLTAKQDLVRTLHVEGISRLEKTPSRYVMAQMRALRRRLTV